MSRRGFLGMAAGSALAGAAGALGAGALPAGAATKGATGTGTVSSASAAALPQPTIQVLTDKRGTAPGHILLAPMLTSYRHGPMMVDNHGHVLWMLPLSVIATNLQEQTYKGEPVLSWWRGKIGNAGYGQGIYRIMDTAYKTIATVKAGNNLQGDLHEFHITPQNTALITIYQPQPRDLSSMGGPANGYITESIFQEIDIATGQVLFQWEASQHVPFQDSYAPVPTSSTQNWDWFHINSISLSSDGNYLVSSRHCWCVYKLDRSNGNVLWRLNGRYSDFNMGPGAKFSWQHHANLHPGHVVTVFDDGAGLYDTESQSRGLKLQLNFQTKACTLIQEYLPQPSMLSSFMGSVQLLPNGNVFVGWGGRPYYSEYTSDGRQIYNASMPTGVFSYRAFRSVWPLPPPT